MAREILRSYVYPPTPAAHAVHHDLESLVWVIIYSLYRRTIREVKQCQLPSTRVKQLLSEYMDLFGTADPGHIRMMRFDDTTSTSFQNLLLLLRPIHLRVLMFSLMTLLRKYENDQSLELTRQREREEWMAYNVQVLLETHAPVKFIAYEHLREILQISIGPGHDIPHTEAT